MSTPFVAIVMGSDSDLPVMEASFAVLRSFAIPFIKDAEAIRVKDEALQASLES